VCFRKLISIQHRIFEAINRTLFFGLKVKIFALLFFACIYLGLFQVLIICRVVRPLARFLFRQGLKLCLYFTSTILEDPSTWIFAWQDLYSHQSPNSLTCPSHYALLPQPSPFPSTNFPFHLKLTLQRTHAIHSTSKAQSLPP
jgi:hypothetical protein